MRRTRHQVHGSLMAVGLVTMMAIGPASAAPDPVAQDSNADLAAYLSDVAADQDIPGMAATVVTPEGTEFEWMSGEDGNGKRVTRDTPFLIGSLAKSMTATLVLHRVEAGTIQLSDPIGERLPWLVDGRPTVEQLLTHTSGYSTADGLAVAERFDNTSGAIRRAAADLDHSGTRDQYEYSDANYLILGALVEHVDGRPFGDVLRTDLLQPLGMNDTASTSEAAADLPAGHRYWWGSPRSYSPGFDESGTPFGYVSSTLDDLIRYARAQNGSNPDVLNPELLREVHAPRVDSGDDEYGFGWRITPSAVGPLINHTGATPGYFAHVTLGPDDQAVLVLANAYSEARAPALAAVAENMLLILDGRSPESSSNNPLLTALPWVLTVLALVGLAMGIMAWWRPVRRGLRWTLAAVAVLIAIAVWLLPGLFGTNLHVMSIWMPDAAVALTIALVTWAAAVAFLLLPRSAYTRVASTVSRSRTGSLPSS